MENKISFQNLQDEENAVNRVKQSRHQFRSVLMQSIKKSYSKAWRNSKEYKEVTASIENFVRLSEQEPKINTVLPLVEAHERLGKACKTYLGSREGAATQRGKDRLAWVSMVSNLHEVETDGINCLRNRETAKKLVTDYSGRTWIDMLGDFRVPEISVSRGEVKSCKDGLSERLRIPYNGRNVYYTKSKPSITTSQFFDQYIAGINGEGVRELFRGEKNVFKDKKGQARYLLNLMGDACEECKYMETPEEAETFKKEAMEAVMQYSPDIFSNGFRQSLERKEVQDVFLDLSQKFSEFAKNKLVYHALGVEPEQDIILHNVASSRIAALVGQPELLAESWRADVLIDGEKSTGVCMEEAKGNEISSEGRMELAKIEVIDTPEFQKSVAGLHLVDLLCGQIDRHEGNMFYQTQDRDGRREACGVQGIDNDVSFGNKAEIDNREDRTLFYNDGVLSIRMPVKFGRLKSVVSVDAKLAVNMISLDRPALDYALGDIIDKKQIDAVEDRLKLIKDHLWNLKAENRWLEGHQWNHTTAGIMEMEDEGNYYARARRAIDLPRRIMRETGWGVENSRSHHEPRHNFKMTL